MVFWRLPLHPKFDLSQFLVTQLFPLFDYSIDLVNEA